MPSNTSQQLPQPLAYLNTQLNPPRWLTTSFLLVATADLTITYFALYHLTTPLVEQNPFAVLTMSFFGPAGLLLPYLTGLTTCIALAILHPWSDKAFQLLLSIYTLYAAYVVTSNILLVAPHL